MNICVVCGNKINIYLKKKAYDGTICNACANLTTQYKSETIKKIKEYYLIESERKKIFKPNKKLKGFASITVLIDDANELFKLGDNPLYKFDEITNFYIARVSGSKVVTTNTKNTGGITRAIIGGMIAGPVGAIVGASTSGSVSTSKDTTPVEIKYYLEITTYSGSFKWEFNPPKGFAEFAAYCINSKKDKAIIKEKEQKDLETKSIDKLMKYKELLENGILTQDEFNKKKKELLNL